MCVSMNVCVSVRVEELLAFFGFLGGAGYGTALQNSALQTNFIMALAFIVTDHVIQCMKCCLRLED